MKRKMTPKQQFAKHQLMDAFERTKHDIEATKQEFEMCTKAVDTSRIYAQQLRKEADECIKKAREQALECLGRLNKLQKQLAVAEIADKMAVSDAGCVLITKETAHILKRGSIAVTATNGTSMRFVARQTIFALKIEKSMIIGLDSQKPSKGIYKIYYNLIKDLEFKTDESEDVFPLDCRLINQHRKVIKMGNVSAEILYYADTNAYLSFYVAIRTDKKPTKS